MRTGLQSLVTGAVIAVSEVVAWGNPALLHFRADAEIDTFTQDVTLFSDRTYTLATVPEALAGKPFLRGSILGLRYTVAREGALTVLTPQRVTGSASCAEALEKAGFKRLEGIGLFQLFGKNEIDRVLTYQKLVKEGETIDFGKFCIPIAFDPESCLRPRAEIQTERLYNNIELPVDPEDRENMASYGNSPLPVPYLKNPPQTIRAEIGRQLFVDDFLIERTTMTRTWHKAAKDERNPVLKPETPLEMGLPHNTCPMAAPFSGGVWYDGTDGLFKMWYCAGWFDGTGYAYSTNGVNWIRPELTAEKGTNRIIPYKGRRDSASVVMDPDAPDGYRFKMLVWSRPQGGEYFLSRNGTEWSEPIPNTSKGDRSTIHYNPFRKVWVLSDRSGWHARSREYVESPDFRAMANLRTHVKWLRADNRDQPGETFFYAFPERKGTQFVPALYNFDAVAYESIMLGAATIMQGPENNFCEAEGVPKMTEIHLAFSRDGFHWSRPDDRSPFIGASRKEGTWDRGYLHSNSALCLVMGDELWFYYTGFAGDTTRKNKSGMYCNASCGIARIRRDGFASMDSGASEATLTTRPLTFSTADRLFVNANSAGGTLRAELLDNEGNVLPGFGLDDAEPISVNSTHAELHWKGGSLASFRDKPIRIRFHARETQLYSFWFSGEKGESRGYLAGGSPGHTTLRDE
ncbi:MAG: glycosyl hydrolase family 32 [Kiritimatiellae bacterium]|nr:glycosyl hydrolase family 32 [Kiritimatiellia bacterium]